jgi:site-specific DNA recombinase
MPSDSRSIVRCAIYTRKSSEEGLEQSFNSLEAQREACQAYISSQKHEHWRGVASHYDDGGYSGGSMERPALRQLLQDKSGSIIWDIDEQFVYFKSKGKDKRASISGLKDRLARAKKKIVS